MTTPHTIPTVPYADIPHAFAVVVTTDSLRGTAVMRGDLLIVDTDDRQPEDGDLVAARHNGDELAALWYRGGAELRSAPDDPDPLVVGPDDDFALLGTVAYTFRGARSWHAFCEK